MPVHITKSVMCCRDISGAAMRLLVITASILWMIEVQSFHFNFLTTSSSGSFPRIQVCFILRPDVRILHRVPTTQKRTTDRILFLKPPSRPPSGGTFSFTEGDEYQSTFDELDAVGGDPAFLDIGSNLLPESDSFTFDNSSTDEQGNLNMIGIGDIPTNSDKFLWDGIPDDEAHLGY
jgi:hypothetical protein